MFDTHKLYLFYFRNALIQLTQAKCQKYVLTFQKWNLVQVLYVEDPFSNILFIFGK